MDENQCDLACDLLNQALGETLSNHRNLMLESKANAQQAHAMVRAGGALLHTKQNPVEAVGIEIIAKNA